MNKEIESFGVELDALCSKYIKAGSLETGDLMVQVATVYSRLVRISEQTDTDYDSLMEHRDNSMNLIASYIYNDKLLDEEGIGELTH